MAQQDNTMYWVLGIGAIAAWWAYENGYLSSIFGTPATASTGTTTTTVTPTTAATGTLCYDVDGYPMTCPSGAVAGSTVSGSLSPLNPAYTAPATSTPASTSTSAPATTSTAAAPTNPWSPGQGLTSSAQPGGFGRRQPMNPNWTPPSSSSSSSSSGSSSSGTSGIGYASRVPLGVVHRMGNRRLSIGAITGGL